MSTVANKFINELKAGNISEAINTIKTGLQESQSVLYEEKRQSILESYGFKIVEKKSEENTDPEGKSSDDDDDDKNKE